MKKIICFLIVAAIAISGCGLKKIPMDQADKEGIYNYRNEGLEFSVELPQEFIYYQTQSKEGDGYKDIEFFVPTADTKFPQEVAGYAKPIVVRGYDEKKWSGLDEGAKERDFMEIGKGNGKIFLIKFWPATPLDWNDKWTEESKNSIIESFKIN